MPYLFMQKCVTGRVDLVFYKMVTISDAKHADKFANLVASNLKPLAFLHGVTAKQACTILSACTGVQFLACWVNSKYCPELPLLLGRLPLRRLSVEFRHFLKILSVLASAWFSNLTHLNLVMWADGYPQKLDLSTLSRLPGVTHVALPSEIDPAHAADWEAHTLALQTFGRMRKTLSKKESSDISQSLSTDTLCGQVNYVADSIIFIERHSDTA
ncbi:hypothetical protein B0H17DRAFT_1129125 [Mycena rosella]|uniref:Uncharacterized protein n=1 Tax=Mycena rosella TaxID=1033263 RepID=A0AAD7DVV6_MYCRO|nr:hypothetical protein B0H17DRAFT_1129125 [Mycena rosella]